MGTSACLRDRYTHDVTTLLLHNSRPLTPTTKMAKTSPEQQLKAFVEVWRYLFMFNQITDQERLENTAGQIHTRQRKGFAGVRDLQEVWGR